MSRIDVQQYDLNVGNNSQNMLPVPIIKKPAPSVPSPNDYGKSPYSMALKPSSRKDDELQYCNFLQPAPRDQRLNVPYQGQKNCPTFKPKPFQKDSCYLMDSKSQGVVGIVCNQAGGSDNANFERGNQFGVDYDYNQFDNIKKKEYTIEQPVQVPMELEMPTIVNDNSTFYPEYNYYLNKNRKSKTYPRPDNYTTTGFPIYKYPYQVLNPRESIDKTTEANYINKLQSMNVENFNNSEDSINNLNENNKFNNQMVLIFVIIFILLMIGYILFY
jgi:hypothetical protein